MLRKCKVNDRPETYMFHQWVTTTNTIRKGSNFEIKTDIFALIENKNGQVFRLHPESIVFDDSLFNRIIAD